MKPRWRGFGLIIIIIIISSCAGSNPSTTPPPPPAPQRAATATSSSAASSSSASSSAASSSTAASSAAPLSSSSANDSATTSRAVTTTQKPVVTCTDSAINVSAGPTWVAVQRPRELAVNSTRVSLARLTPPEGNVTWEDSDASGNTSSVFEGLMECGSYELRIHDSQSHETCREIVNTTQLDPEIMNLMGNSTMSLNSVSISLQWELFLPPRCQKHPDYDVSCCADNVCVPGTAQSSRVGSEMFVSSKLMDVGPHTEFICSVIASLEGQQRANVSINVTSDVTAPSPPHVTRVSVGEDRATFLYITCSTCTWGVQYNTHVTPHGGSDCSITGATVTCNGLKPFTDYTLRVTATNTAVGGRGTPYESFSDVAFKTLEGVPTEPRALNLHLVQHNAVKVTWDKPADPRGVIKNYLVTILAGDNLVVQKNEINRDVTFSDLSFLTQYHVQVVAFNGRHKSQAIGQSISTKYNERALIGCLSFLIIAIAIALACVLYKIYVLHKRSRSVNITGERVRLIDIDGEDGSRLLVLEPIAASELAEAVKSRETPGDTGFQHEFDTIPRVFKKFPCSEALQSFNVGKNRYIDILPYDHNRVVLSAPSGKRGCDYVNASYIDGYKEAKKYIAAQGPTPDTAADFWRMIWEQKVSTVIMVTQCVEGGKVKCHQYWPKALEGAGLLREGSVSVRLKEERRFLSYTLRRMEVSNSNEPAVPPRPLTHLQLISWPDHGVPSDPADLLTLRRRAREVSGFFCGPTLVHCSAGVGRSGTYMALDSLCDCLLDEGHVDVYRTVLALRRQRCLMVQTVEQYEFLYRCLLEFHTCGDTEMSVAELRDKKLTTTLTSTLTTSLTTSSPLGDDDDDDAALASEFALLPNFDGVCPQSVGTRPENITRNNSLQAIAYDVNRVALKRITAENFSGDEEGGGGGGGGGGGDDDDDDVTDDDVTDDDDDDEEEEGGDVIKPAFSYINASLVDGYQGVGVFVVTQSPTEGAVSDFWHLVVQLRVTQIVCLSKEGEEDGGEGGEGGGEGGGECCYWPREGGALLIGDFQVTLTSRMEVAAGITKRSLGVSCVHGRREVSQLQCAAKRLLSSPNLLCTLAEELGGALGTPPILVHCADGSSMSPTLCAALSVRAMALGEGRVDVFTTARRLRRQRSGAIPLLVHYRYCYQVASITACANGGPVEQTTTTTATTTTTNATTTTTNATTTTATTTTTPTTTLSIVNETAEDSGKGVERNSGNETAEDSGKGVERNSGKSEREMEAGGGDGGDGDDVDGRDDGDGGDGGDGRDDGDGDDGGDRDDGDDDRDGVHGGGVDGGDGDVDGDDGVDGVHGDDGDDDGDDGGVDVDDGGAVTMVQEDAGRAEGSGGDGSSV